MIPPLIINESLAMGINLLAVTDHNASANAWAVMEAAQGTGISVLPGMELQTREEVHLLCLFDTLQQLETWQALVNSALPDIPNNVEFFGEQFVVDSEGEFIRREGRLLLNSANIGLEQAAEQVTALGGLAIPAHIDRKANGLIELLGLIPPGFEALEISRHISPSKAREKFPQIGRTPLVQNGDAHLLDGLLGTTEFELEAPNIAEIRLALKGEGERTMRIR